MSTLCSSIKRCNLPELTIHQGLIPNLSQDTGSSGIYHFAIEEYRKNKIKEASDPTVTTDVKSQGTPEKIQACSLINGLKANSSYRNENSTLETLNHAKRHTGARIVDRRLSCRTLFSKTIHLHY